MADFIVTNYARLNADLDPAGKYPLDETSGIVETAAIGGNPTITKTADKTIWIDGNLIYTIVFKNESDTLNLYNVVVTDPLDSNVTYNYDAVVTSNMGTLHAVSITYDAGVLRINFNQFIAPSEIITIVFSVSK